MKKTIGLDCISRARGLLMGIATLWVAVYHSRFLDFTQSRWLMRLDLGQTINDIKAIGNAGVDLFLFLSGYGLYYAFAKNSSIRIFYARRFSRILPAMLIVTIIFYGWQGTDGLVEYIATNLHFALYHPDVDRREFWFFSLIIVLYLLYPLFHKAIQRFGIWGLLGISALTVLGTFHLRRVNREYFEKVEIALTRVPVFLAGIWIGKKSREGVRLPVWLAALSVIAAGACLVYVSRLPQPPDYEFLQRYFYFPLSILLALGIAVLDSVVPNNPMKRLIELIGLYSLEIYLIYEQLYLHMTHFYMSSDEVGISYGAACFVMALLLAFGLKKASGLIAKTVWLPKNLGETA